MSSKKLEISYYSLKKDKPFKDGSTVYAGTVVRRILPEDEDSFTVETIDDIEKKIFWVNESEVKFEKTTTETWTKEMLEQQEKERNNSWFTNG